MKTEENKKFTRWCILGAIGGILMAAGDWLLGCIPLQGTDTGMFNRSYYLSGSYGLWRPVLIVGMGAVGSFLYYFMVKALNADIDAKYRKTKSVQYLCGIFTVAVALAIHLWSATLAWFTTYLGPRIGSEAALTTVTAYQDDMLIAILPMYFPMVLFIGIHFVMLLIGKTRYPRWMLVFHPVTWNILLAVIPDIAQAMQVPVATWMSVMSQSSTNSAIVIWCIAVAIYEKRQPKRVYAKSQYAKPYERYCRELYPDEAGAIFEKAGEYYLEFMKDMPDLGENMMAKNMLDWFTILSFYEASEHRLDGEALLEIKHRMVDKMKFLGKFVDGNKHKWPYKLFEKTYVKFIRMQKEHQARGEWMDSWRVEINPEHRTEGFCFHLIGCPIAKHAKEHGYEELLPYLCKTDHYLAEVMHARLIRTQTEALGGDCCDYWYVGDKSPVLEKYKDLEQI